MKPSETRRKALSVLLSTIMCDRSGNSRGDNFQPSRPGKGQQHAYFCPSR